MAFVRRESQTQLDTVAEPIANGRFLTTAVPPVDGSDSKVAEWKYGSKTERNDFQAALNIPFYRSESVGLGLSS